MTITDSDIIVTPTMGDKKLSSIDLSDSLFDYDLLLEDVNNTPKAIQDDLFNSLFQQHHQPDSSKCSSSESPSSSITTSTDSKRPQIIQWGPNDGHESSTIVSIVLKHTQEIAPMKIVFGSLTVETAQQQHRYHDNETVWITLAASVPPLLETRSESNQIKISVCLFDRHDPDIAIDTWDIGLFTYRIQDDNLQQEQELNPRKRALSCEPEEGTEKRPTYDVKQEDNNDVNSQLLKLLAPYDPLLTVGSSPNMISNTQNATPSWMSSTMNFHSQSTTASTYPQNEAIRYQQQMINKRQTEYLPKQIMTRNYINPQQQQRPFILQQQQQEQQQHIMNHYVNHNNFNHPAPQSNYNPHHHNPVLFNMAEQQKQNQLFQLQHQQRLNAECPRRASAPATSYSITNSNSCALNKAHLKLNGDLMDMMVNWSMPEWQSGRRLVHFWRQTKNGPDGNLAMVECGFDPMDQQVYHQQRMRDNVAAVAAAAAAAVAVSNSPPNSTPIQPPSRPTPIVVSCIYWRERNDYFITSVDCIYLLESLIGIQFTVEEKNRIRRNLEGFRPLTVSKCKLECADFFKLIMSFPHPKPRNIEKDVKVFAWKTLPHALRKIIRKYTPSYITSTPLEPIQQHQHNRYNSPSYGNNMF